MMPINVMVFVGCMTIGLIIFAMTRSQWSDELTRLNKHTKRMSDKNAENAEVSIFVTQKVGYLGKVLSQAGMEAKYDQMRMNWIVSAVGGIVLGAAICMFSMPELVILGGILGGLIGAGGFVFYLQGLAKGRQDKMTEQLPQSLETMVSSLRAGSPIMEAFKVLAETAPDPIKSEFKRGLVSLQLGKPFRDVMGEMADRIRTPDFKLLTQAIFISQDVGGNLADVVAVIAEAIRERFKLRDFLNALTAQGKATAMFIGCLPYGITLMTYLATPGYIVPFLNHPIARIVMIALVLWEALGFWILMKLTTFEV
ncbi:MAG: type II secretion system F family protein [Candidatus Obscuribacterales bacterium]|nr:type II secretion system F family protein [Candidatus Obscuribacterales bacterium]